MLNFQNAKFLKLRQVKTTSVEKAIISLLTPTETIVGAYKTVRDFVVFTEKRIIAVDIQGVTGVKRSFTTLPYSNIQVFSIQTAGIFDLDSELDLYFNELGHVIFEFTGGCNITEISRFISSCID